MVERRFSAPSSFDPLNWSRVSTRRHLRSMYQLWNCYSSPLHPPKLTLTGSPSRTDSFFAADSRRAAISRYPELPNMANSSSPPPSAYERHTCVTTCPAIINRIAGGDAENNPGRSDSVTFVIRFPNLSTFSTVAHI